MEIIMMNFPSAVQRKSIKRAWQDLTGYKIVKTKSNHREQKASIIFMIFI